MTLKTTMVVRNYLELIAKMKKNHMKFKKMILWNVTLLKDTVVFWS